MRILDNCQMREADLYTIEVLGVPALTLMERAGEAVCRAVESMYARGKIVCVCGGGNNGGDGFVCARLLKQKGYDVCAVCIADKFSEACQINKEKFLAVGGEILTGLPACGLVVDCMFGTGFHGAPTGAYAELIKAINRSATAVLSVDIPSGVNGDDGSVLGEAVCAHTTLCIGEVKAGVYLGDGIDYAGEIIRVDIGITLPKENYAERIDSALVREIVPRRKRNSHKGDYGRCAIVAGSENYTGACYLATLGCLRAGAGYTTLFAPENVIKAMYFQCPEALLVAVSEGGRYAFNEARMRDLLGYSSIVYGSGMGVDEEVAKGLAFLLANYTGKLIIDADGLNALVGYGVLPLLKGAKCEITLTPHLKEFSRLSGKTVAEIKSAGLYAPRAFAKEYGVNVLLKSAVSILTDGARTLVNTAGTAGQAKGGSGDVLAGVIGGLCASGLSAFDGAVAGAYLVGKSAELGAQKQGEYSLLATDICACLGGAFLSLFSEDAHENGDGE